MSTGLEPRFITAELTLAEVTLAMADLIPLTAKSLAAAEQTIDGLCFPGTRTGLTTLEAGLLAQAF